MLLGWLGAGGTLIDGVANPFLNYAIALQFSAFACGATFTAASLAMASIARTGYEVTESLCRLVQGAIEHEADLGIPSYRFGSIAQPPIAYRAVAHPITWRAARAVALMAEAVCMTTIYLAARHISLFPPSDQYTLAALFVGIAATCAAISITGARQQKVVTAMRTAAEVDRQLKELLQPVDEVPVLRSVPFQPERTVGGRRHHLRRTAGE
jgi:hypothetical protein